MKRIILFLLLLLTPIMVQAKDITISDIISNFTKTDTMKEFIASTKAKIYLEKEEEEKLKITYDFTEAPKDADLVFDEDKIIVEFTLNNSALSNTSELDLSKIEDLEETDIDSIEEADIDGLMSMLFELLTGDNREFLFSYLSYINLLEEIGVLKGYQAYEVQDFLTSMTEISDPTHICTDTGICINIPNIENENKFTLEYSVDYAKYKLIQNDYPAPTISIDSITNNSLMVNIDRIKGNFDKNLECNILYSEDNETFKSSGVKVNCYEPGDDSDSTIGMGISNLKPNTTYFIKSNVVNSKNYSETKIIKTLSDAPTGDTKGSTDKKTDEKIDEKIDEKKNEKVSSPKTGIDSYLNILSIILALSIFGLYFAKNKDLFKKM